MEEKMNQTDYLMAALLMAKNLCEQETGKSAFDDYYTSHMTHAAMTTIIDKLIDVSKPADLVKQEDDYKRLMILYKRAYPQYSGVFSNRRSLLGGLNGSN